MRVSRLEKAVLRNLFALALIILFCGIRSLEPVAAQSDAFESRYVVRVGEYDSELAARTALLNWRKDYIAAFVEAPDGNNEGYRIFIGPYDISDALAVATEISLKRKDIDVVDVLMWHRPVKTTESEEVSNRLFVVSLGPLKSQSEAAELEDRLRKAGYDDVFVETHARSYHVRVGPSPRSRAQNVAAKLSVEYGSVMILPWADN